ncbi:hypothetical protein [Larkinella terrae]|uniref:HEAT repeat domain-containing protein n=1 Tax=Larkinella terrae TaxID=2025311 RepID=A0A7K0ENM2_9BACT|nr:hypothetical protein [Larkinella terrae]MRS63058.1 hypothetical protein [Larkinella terrae]
MYEMTSKDLYFANGGQTHYIYRDGFGDQYKASPAEEAAWRKELIEREWKRLHTETNAVLIKALIGNLMYHNADKLVPKLTKKLAEVSPETRVVIAGSLWRINGYKKSFSIIQETFRSHREAVLSTVFATFQEMVGNQEVAVFLINCLENNDAVLCQKAHVTLTMWSYMGLPQLRDGDLINRLSPEDKRSNPDTFQAALKTAKCILKIR